MKEGNSEPSVMAADSQNLRYTEAGVFVCFHAFKCQQLAKNGGMKNITLQLLWYHIWSKNSLPDIKPVSGTAAVHYISNRYTMFLL